MTSVYYAEVYKDGSFGRVRATSFWGFDPARYPKKTIFVIADSEDEAIALFEQGYEMTAAAVRKKIDKASKAHAEARYSRYTSGRGN